MFMNISWYLTHGAEMAEALVCQVRRMCSCWGGGAGGGKFVYRRFPPVVLLAVDIR